MRITEAALGNRVRRWQKILAPLGVGHFRIKKIHLCAETPSGPDAKATVHAKHDYDSAEFWFTHDYLRECDTHDLDETIIHEWLHVAMRDLDHALEAVENWMPTATYEGFQDTVEHECEGFIDRIARLIYALHRTS